MYSSIDPINGETFHLMDFDDAATNQTDTFIKALQERFPDDHLVIVWDRAPFHKPKSLLKKHMTLIHLPSYSPQLNPVERFFGEMRKFTANKIFTQGIQALSETVEKAVLKLCSNTEAIQRLTGYDWIMQQWKLVSEWMIVRCAC
jgi:hypothetical protein